MIEFQCPSCGYPLSVPDCLAGCRESCPVCDADCRVPRGSTLVRAAGRRLRSRLRRFVAWPLFPFTLILAALAGLVLLVGGLGGEQGVGPVASSPGTRAGVSHSGDMNDALDRLVAEGKVQPLPPRPRAHDGMFPDLPILRRMLADYGFKKPNRAARHAILFGTNVRELVFPAFPGQANSRRVEVYLPLGSDFPVLAVRLWLRSSFTGGRPDDWMKSLPLMDRLVWGFEFACNWTETPPPPGPGKVVQMNTCALDGFTLVDENGVRIDSDGSQWADWRAIVIVSPSFGPID